MPKSLGISGDLPSRRIIGRALQSSGAGCAVRREKSPATFPRPAD